MSHHSQRGGMFKRAQWSVGLVGVLAGLLFATNASLFAGSDDHLRPDNLTDLIRDERDRLEDTNDEVSELRAEVSQLLDDSKDPAEVDVAPGIEFAAAHTELTGPGVKVELWDAPARDDEDLPSGVHQDDLIVHQEDLEAVMNGLWAGGAEAMMVQGHRVSTTSNIRCVGNVLLIDGSVYSPPYELSAVGDPDLLEEALLSSSEVSTYLQYVEALQLGWSLDSDDELELPAADGSVAMGYAQAPGEDPITLPSDQPSHDRSNGSGP